MKDKSSTNNKYVNIDKKKYLEIYLGSVAYIYLTKM